MLNLILDLDNTIISSIEMYKLSKLGNHSENFEHIDMDTSFRVFKRPYLEEFLDYIFKNFKVSVFTAASKEYALFIIDNIILTKPNRKLDFIFFDHHVDISERKKKHPKYLELLWKFYKFPGYNKENTFIIDDNTLVHEKQLKNVVKAKYFDVSTKKHSVGDTFLKDVIKELKELSSTAREATRKTSLASLASSQSQKTTSLNSQDVVIGQSACRKNVCK